MKPLDIKPSPRPQDPFILVLILAVSLFLGLTAASQRFAIAVGFDAGLGPPVRILDEVIRGRLLAMVLLLASTALVMLFFQESRRFFLLVLSASLLLYSFLPGQVYKPVQIIAWSRQVSGDAGLERVLRRAQIEGALFGLLSLVGLFLAARPSPRAGSHAHGSAAWGSGRSLRQKEGLPLGRIGGDMLRYRGDGHLLTIAPTRSGKGVSAVIPALLTYPGPVVVTDIKGENYAVAARARRELFGQPALALDPFGVTGAPPARLNPLDLTSPENAFDEAWMLADMLVIERGGGEGFWNEEARALIAGLLYFIMTEPDATRVLTPGGDPLPRDLLSVRRLLTLPPEAMEVFFERLALGDGLVARAASRHLQKADKERSGVLSTALSHTHFLDAPAMGVVLGCDDRKEGSTAVDPYKLLDGSLSLFLVLPPDRLATYRGWLRLMIASCLLVLTRQRPASRVLFLLDEFANLGRMDLIAQAVTLMAGYGAAFWFFIQDLPRLRSVYPSDWETFLANCEALQAFGSRDPMTCQYLSRRTGQQTVFVRSDSQAAAAKGSPYSVSVSETGRALLLSDEVEQLGEDEELLFVRGERPIRAKKLVYFNDRIFQRGGKPLFDSNPLVKFS